MNTNRMDRDEVTKKLVIGGCVNSEVEVATGVSYSDRSRPVVAIEFTYTDGNYPSSSIVVLTKEAARALYGKLFEVMMGAEQA